jgi:hypothetical protein
MRVIGSDFLSIQFDIVMDLFAIMKHRTGAGVEGEPYSCLGSSIVTKYPLIVAYRLHPATGNSGPGGSWTPGQSLSSMIKAAMTRMMNHLGSGILKKLLASHIHARSTTRFMRETIRRCLMDRSTENADNTRDSCQRVSDS